GDAGHGLDVLDPVVEWGEIPPGAFRADHPEAAFPFVEGQPAPDAESRWAAVAVELAVTERAGPKHGSPARGHRGHRPIRPERLEVELRRPGGEQIGDGGAGE